MKYLSDFDKFNERVAVAFPKATETETEKETKPAPAPVRREKPAEPIQPSKPNPPSRKADPGTEEKPMASDVVQRLQNILSEKGESLEDFYKKNKKK